MTSFGSPEEQALYQAHRKMGLEEGRQFSYRPGEALPFVELDLNTALGFGTDPFTRALAEAQGLTVTDLAPATSLNAAMSALRRVRAGALPAPLGGRRTAQAAHTVGVTDDGTNHATVLKWAARFVTPSTQKLSCPSSADLQVTNQFSVCAWVKATDTNTANGSRTILHKYLKHDAASSLGSVYGELILNMAWNILTLQWELSFRVGILVGSSYDFGGITQIPVGVAIDGWFHVAGTFDLVVGTSMSAAIYVNGALAGSNSGPVSSTIIRASVSPLVIGGDIPADPDGVTPSAVRGWLGDIDAVGIYRNHKLTAAEVLALYNSGAGLNYGGLTGSLLTGLAAWYDMGEVTGATRIDSNAGLHNLTDTGSVAQVTGKT